MRVLVGNLKEETMATHFCLLCHARDKKSTPVTKYWQVKTKRSNTMSVNIKVDCCEFHVPVLDKVHQEGGRKFAAVLSWIEAGCPVLK